MVEITKKNQIQIPNSQLHWMLSHVIHVIPFSLSTFLGAHADSCNRSHRSHTAQYRCGYCKLEYFCGDSDATVTESIAHPVAVEYPHSTFNDTLTCSSHFAGVLNYFFLRATKDQRKFKDRCLRAKWSPLSYVFLCTLELTNGQTHMVCGPDLAQGPPFEAACYIGTAFYETHLAGQEEAGGVDSRLLMNYGIM